MDYKTHEELFGLLKEVLGKRYMMAIANIAYLEELKQKNFVVYLSQLKDIFSHSSVIFNITDIHAYKTKIIAQLNSIKGHIERIIFDTFTKLSDVKQDMIYSSFSTSEVNSYKVQIALKVKNVRILDSNISFEEKVNAWEDIQSFLDEIIKNIK